MAEKPPPPIGVLPPSEGDASPRFRVEDWDTSDAVKSLASVKDGKITAPEGLTYSLVGDKIVAADGTELGYLGPFIGAAKRTGHLADQLFRSR